MAPSPGACSTICWRTSGSSIEGISGTSAGAINAVHAGGRAGARRAARGAQAARRFLARGEPRRQPAGAAARGDRPAVLVHAARRLRRCRPGSMRCRAICRPTTSTRSTSIRCKRPDRTLRRFRGGAHMRDLQLFVSATNVQTGRAARVSAREDHGRRGDGVGLPAALVPRGRDRRRALLGRRLSSATRRSFRSSAPPTTEDVLVVQINPLVRARDADVGAGDHEPHQRDHVQLLADRRISRHRVRRPPDRSGPLAARHRAGRIPAHQRAPHRARAGRQAASTPASKLNTDFDFFEMLRLSGRRAARRFLDAHFDDIGVRSDGRPARRSAQAEWA